MPSHTETIARPFTRTIPRRHYSAESRGGNGLTMDVGDEYPGCSQAAFEQCFCRPLEQATAGKLTFHGDRIVRTDGFPTIASPLDDHPSSIIDHP